MKTILFLTCFLISNSTFAQVKKPTLHIALFSSFYLDLNFNNQAELNNPKEFPKQSLSALEFYEGAGLAIDSLNTYGRPVLLKVYDVQSTHGNISKAFENGDFDKIDLIISQVGGNDFFQLAIIARELNIPLINATYPNTKGIDASAKLYVANPRIGSHLELIRQKINRNWKNANTIWFTTNRDAEKQITGIFRNLNNVKSQNFLKYRTVYLNDKFTKSDIIKYFDTSKNNVWILGSLDDNLAYNFIKILREINQKTKLHIIGMPNWEYLKEPITSQLPDLPFYYTSAFHVSHENPFIKGMNDLFKQTMGINCPQMTLRGFEITYYFGSLLRKYGQIKIGQPEDEVFKVLTNFNFQPVNLNPLTTEPDFFENKNIQFMRRLNSISLPYF